MYGLIYRSSSIGGRENAGVGVGGEDTRRIRGA